MGEAYLAVIDVGDNGDVPARGEGGAGARGLSGGGGKRMHAGCRVRRAVQRGYACLMFASLSICERIWSIVKRGISFLQAPCSPLPSSPLVDRTLRCYGEASWISCCKSQPLVDVYKTICVYSHTFPISAARSSVSSLLRSTNIFSKPPANG